MQLKCPGKSYFQICIFDFTSQYGWIVYESKLQATLSTNIENLPPFSQIGLHLGILHESPDHESVQLH